jgi:phosphoadenosine phosphosulfate reductase
VDRDGEGVSFPSGTVAPGASDAAGAPPPAEAQLAEADGLLGQAGLEPVAQAEAVIRWLAARYLPGVALACSFGVEDCVLVDLVQRVAPAVTIFYLDTELLFPETYATRDRLVEKYGIHPVAVSPRQTVQQQAEAFGAALWSRDPDLCCRLRKVEPLAAFLRGQRAWITGIRREQSPTRAGTPLLQWDHRFGLAKGNPLAAWRAADIWHYVHAREVPYNPLHDHGYPSIGCWPCTRAVRPEEDPRAGRWSGFAKTECGLHG